MTEMEKLNVMALFVEEYAKAKEKKDERKDKGNN